MAPHPLHEKAKSLAGGFLKLEAELLSVIAEIDKQKLFRSWGYASLFQYVFSLGFTEAQVYTLTKVSRKCEEVPLLKEAINRGEVSISKAARVVSVIANSNAPLWIEKASNLSSHQLEKQVQQERPSEKVRESIKPVATVETKVRLKLTVAISEDLELKLRRLQNIYSKKLKRNCSLEECLELATELSLEKLDPVEKAKRASEKAKLSPDIVRMATSVPAQVKHQVVLRDKGLCQWKLPGGNKCGNSRFTEIHHRLPRSLGGGHGLENLITLCSQHHGIVHERG